MYRLRTGLDEERQHVATIRAQEGEQADLMRMLDSITVNHDEMKTYFIHEQDVVGFLELIEALGRAHGAAVTTASIDVAKGDGHVDELQLTIKATGSKNSVQHVLELLETLPYRSIVTSAVLGKKGDGTSDNEWEGTFKVAVGKYTES